MKKEDLRAGMVVETLKGNKLLIGKYENDLFVVSLGGLFIDKLIDFDYQAVYKVYKDNTLQKVLWERKEVPQLSDEAISLLKLLPKKWKYIARDKDFMDNEVWVYTYQPCIEIGKNGSVYFKPEPISEHKGNPLYTFSELLECFPKGECYLIEDLIKGE